MDLGRLVKTTLKALAEPVRDRPEIFHAIRSILSPPPRIYRHLHFRGVFETAVGASHAFKIRHHGNQWENALFWGGVAATPEPSSLLIWSALCQGSQQIVDVGANTGIYALTASASNREAAVVAVEPVPRVCRKLRANAALNDFSLQVVQAAASDADGYATLYDTESSHVYSASLEPEQLGSSASRQYEVRVRRLDSLLPELGMRAPELIKVDVERGEAKVLTGMEGFLREARPTLLVEVLDRRAGEGPTALISSIEGYEMYAVREDSFRLERVWQLGGSADRNYLICTAGDIGRLRSILPELG